jgi:hypothetical protein
LAVSWRTGGGSWRSATSNGGGGVGVGVGAAATGPTASDAAHCEPVPATYLARTRTIIPTSDPVSV